MPDYDAIAEFYDQWALGDPACLPSETFYRRLCLAAIGTVVEVGVGTGRIALELARHGRSIIGIDISEPMLAACRRKAESLGVTNRLTLCRMDARRLGLRGVDLVILPFRTIGHFTTRAARRAIFAELHAALAPGGRFVFDHYIMDRTWAETHDGVPRLMYRSASFAEDGLFVWDTYRYDFAAGVMDCIVTVERTASDGTVAERRHTEFPFAWVTPAEVAHLAAEVGFRVESTHGDFDGGPLTHGSSNQVWILRKY